MPLMARSVLSRAIWGLVLSLACTAPIDQSIDRVSAERTRPIVMPFGAAPSLSTTVGGSGQDVIRDLVIEPNGETIAVGSTLSPNWSYGGPFSGTADAVVLRIASTGQPLAGTLVGGPGYERAYGVALATNGDIVIAGRAGPGLPNALNAFAGGPVDNLYGPQDGFACRLSAGLVVVWCRYLGVNDNAIVRDVGTDSQGNVYLIAGLSAGSPNYDASYPVAGASLPRVGGSDAVLIKLTPTGSPSWIAYISGSGNESGQPSLAMHGDTAVVVVATNSPNLPGGPLHGVSDLWIAAYAPSGSARIWDHYLGGNGGEAQETNNIAVASNGEIYVGATSSSTDLPASGSAFPVYAGGGTGCGNYCGDAAIWRLSPAGVVLGAVYYGGSKGDGQEGIAVTDSSVAIGGTAYSLDLPVVQQWVGFGGRGDGFLAVFSRDLTALARATYVTAPGSRLDNIRAVAMAPNRLIAAGWSESNWPVINPWQSFGGQYDATLTLW